MLSVCNALVLMAGPLNIRVAHCRWVAMEVQGKMKQEQKRGRLRGRSQRSHSTDLCLESFFSLISAGVFGSHAAHWQRFLSQVALEVFPL